MKNLLAFIVCICFSTSGFSQIIEAEYFIDTDPGIGSAMSLTVTAGNTLDENFSSIPTTGLAEGLHTLHIRAKGTNNIWSLYKRAYFYIQALTTNGTPQNIVAAEYYIDTDNLGVGNQTPLTVTPGMTINEAFAISTTGLAEGLHVLQIRVKDADDMWSLYKRAYFYVQAPTTNGIPKNIVAAEYYIDNDVSGVGGSQTPGMVTPGMAIGEAFTIPTAGLTQGLHVLHIRVKDADDTWSLYKRAYFYTHSANSNATATPILAAEYFFDTDPGVGSATSVAVTQGFNVDDDLVIQVPSAMTDGDHYLYLRVQDQDGTWSLYKRALFTVDVLSVEDFNSDSFKIFPNPTKDIIHINFKQFGDYSFSVYNISGKEIFKQESLEFNNTFNLSKYASGIYILKIKDKTSNSFQNVKIVKL